MNFICLAKSQDLTAVVQRFVGPAHNNSKAFPIPISLQGTGTAAQNLAGFCCTNQVVYSGCVLLRGKLVLCHSFHPETFHRRLKLGDLHLDYYNFHSFSCKTGCKAIKEFCNSK